MPPRHPRVYLVTDPSAGSGLVARTASALRALPPGSAAVQLRDRGASARELLALALSLREVASSTGQVLLVNDRIDVAVASGADGVHLPSAGTPPAEARRLLGSRPIVSVSCHSREDVSHALAGGADFATFGPVYDTPSKRGFGPPVGLDRFRDAAAMGLPLVGLGGIDPGNARAVVAAGAAGVAAIRAWLEASDPGEAARRLLAAVDGTGG
jgi:thiamine-phosphate pyrophosphorylase